MFGTGGAIGKRWRLPQLCPGVQPNASQRTILRLDGGQNNRRIFSGEKAPVWVLAGHIESGFGGCQTIALGQRTSVYARNAFLFFSVSRTRLSFHSSE
jgi:hypothetical protein